MSVADLVKSGNKIIIAEITPPLDNNSVKNLEEKLRSLKGLDIDGIDVTSSSLGKNRLDYPDVVENIRGYLGNVPIIANIASRDTTDENIIKKLENARQCGISDILVILGDDYEKSLKRLKTPRIVHEINSYRKRNDYDLGIIFGVRGYYGGNNLDKHLELLKRVEDLGVDCLMTKVLTDSNSAKLYYDSLSKHGINLPVIGQVMFLDNERKIDFVEKNNIVACPVPDHYKAELQKSHDVKGKKILSEKFALDLIKSLFEIPGYKGVAINIIYGDDPKHFKNISSPLTGLI